LQVEVPTSATVNSPQMQRALAGTSQITYPTQISQVARDYKVDRKTVRKYISQDDWNEAWRAR